MEAASRSAVQVAETSVVDGEGHVGPERVAGEHERKVVRDDVVDRRDADDGDAYSKV